MSHAADATRGRELDPPDALRERVRRSVDRHSALQCLQLVRDLCLLDPEFECAFPRASRSTSPSLADGVERLAEREAMRSGAKESIRGALERLRSSNGNRESDASLLAIARDSARTMLDAVLAAPDPPAGAWILRAQMRWVFDDGLYGIAEDLASALERAERPREVAIALLHLALLQADRGEVDPAIRMLQRAALLAPRALAIHFTLGVYALAAGLAAIGQESLLRAASLGTAAERRRRTLTAPRHFEALTRVGAGSAKAIARNTDTLRHCLAPHLNDELCT